MRLRLAFTLIFAAALTINGAPAPATSPSAAPKAAEKKNEKADQKKPDANSPFGNLMQGSDTGEPTTTEIYADEAFFDSAKSMGIFTGHVKVVDPRFNMQSDKLTVFISKSQTAKEGQAASPSPSPAPTAPAEPSPQPGGQGLEKAIAEGNVAVVRDRPDPNGGPPTRAVGRADIATYVSATGNVELKGTPRVQQGENTHIGDPDTVMIINQNGQLTTHGPSRTEIRQQPKNDDEPSASGSPGEKKGGKGEKKDGKGEKKGENAKAPAKSEKSPAAKP